MIKKIVIEADSVEETRKIAESQQPKGFQISTENIINDGKPVSIQTIANTAEEAYAKLQKKIPSDAEIIKREGLSRAGERTKEIEAFDEDTAKKSRKLKIKDFESFMTIEMIKEGSKGFLGMNKKPHLYRITISKRAKVKVIFKKKAKVEYSFTPKSLEEAIFDGDIEEVKMIMQSSEDPIDMPDDGGYTPLMYASLYGHTEIVKLFLSKGANVNAATSWGATALTRAAQDGKIKIVELLLASGANVNATEYDGYTALSRAAMKGHGQIAWMLLSKGADVNIRTKHGHSALTLAEENGHHQVIAILQNAT